MQTLTLESAPLGVADALSHSCLSGTELSTLPDNRAPASCNAEAIVVEFSDQVR